VPTAFPELSSSRSVSRSALMARHPRRHSLDRRIIIALLSRDHANPYERVERRQPARKGLRGRKGQKATREIRAIQRP
jgi:hypothetical protein